MSKTNVGVDISDDFFSMKQTIQLFVQVHCNGIVSNHNHLTRLAVKSDSVLTKEPGLEYEGLSRRTRTISASCPGTNNEYSQLSPTGSDITHHLRSRKQLWLPTSLLGTTAEDAVNNSRLKLSRDYPFSEAMSPAQAKGSLKSPTTLVAEDRRGSGKDEEERNPSKLPHNEFNNFDKSESCAGDEDEDIDTESEKYCPRVREKFEDKKTSSKKKLKKRIISSREVANLSYCDDRRRKVLKKRLSVEEKLIEDNKTYYKVEVLNSKLRSTGYYISQSQRELEMSRANGNDGCVTQNCSEPSKNEIKSEGKEPVVVRFKKVRQTQLSILSDEAESFMFGEPSKRESSVSTESSEDDDEVSLKLESEERGRIVTRIKREVLDDSSIGSSSLASSSTSSRRKRKSPDSIISSDNTDFCKPDGPTSRLRLHNNLLSVGPDHKEGIKLESPYELRSERNSLKVTLNENDFDCESADDDKPLSECKNSHKHSYEDLEFSFERAPTHEPWYQTFKRQDDCNQFYYPSYSSYPSVLLPYEYPFSVIKQIKTAAMSSKCKRRRRRKQKRIKKLIADDRPRKSPRCHASTLAIMSSLGKRRLRDSPDKRTELLSSELPVVPSVMMVDEESRCSTIIDPPSITPSDSQMSHRTPAQTVPEIRIDQKLLLAAETKKAEEETKKAEESIDQLFTEMCYDNNDDVIAHIIQSIKKEVDSSPAKDSSKKGKGKGKSSLKREPSINVEESPVCLPVDPDLFDEELVECSFTPGPIVDVLSLIDGYRSCSSMERADYEHMNPHAVDALRVLIADSCNSSDCGGSSACDYSFLEDGRVCKRKKKKKRNMTGWPANKKKFMRKGEELSTVVLRRNCRTRDGMSAGPDPVKETQTQPRSDKVIDSEVVVKLKVEPNSTENLDNSVDSDVKTDSSKPDVKPCSTISRTTSLDSSSIKSFDHVQSCYIRVNKMSDGCLETLSRRLRSSDSSPHSSSRRGSSRQAKSVGINSLRRCR